MDRERKFLAGQLCRLCNLPSDTRQCQKQNTGLNKPTIVYFSISNSHLILDRVKKEIEHPGKIQNLPGISVLQTRRKDTATFLLPHGSSSESFVSNLCCVVPLLFFFFFIFFFLLLKSSWVTDVTGPQKSPLDKSVNNIHEIVCASISCFSFYQF